MGTKLELWYNLGKYIIGGYYMRDIKFRVWDNERNAMLNSKSVDIDFFEGKIDSDFDMVEAIFRGFIKSSEYCFCFCVNSTFCWFTVKDGSVKSHGKLQFSFERTKYYVGKFIKRLIYSIVSTGFNVSNIKFLFWSNEDYLPEFQPYIVITRSVIPGFTYS